MLIQSTAKQLCNGILWGKPAHQSKQLVFTTDSLTNVIRVLATWKGSYRDTPVSIYLNNCKEAVEEDCLDIPVWHSTHSVPVVDYQREASPAPHSRPIDYRHRMRCYVRDWKKRKRKENWLYKQSSSTVFFLQLLMNIVYLCRDHFHVVRPL